MGTSEPSSAEDAAIAWFVRLRDETAGKQDRSAFEAWLQSDTAHERAWHELEQIWGRLDTVSGSASARSSLSLQPRARPRRSAARHLAAAAVVLLGLATGWQLAPAGLLADYRSGIGERRTISLADGSQMELGPGSAADVTFGGGQRSVRLVAGEAFFTVARNAGRPFVVEAGQGKVEVLGTAFDVKLRADDGVEVVVTESTVAVSAARGEPVRVSQGQGVSFDRAGLSPVRPADLDSAQAWRQDQLVFHDAPLSTVLAELSRYRRGHVQLIGSSLGERRVTAVFDARHIDAALDSIARSLDLRVLRATNWLVALVPA